MSQDDLYLLEVEHGPLGPLSLFASDTALVGLYMPEHKGMPALSARPAPRHSHGHAILARTRAQLAEYFAGERTVFDVPVLLRGTDFQRAVWAALRAIPLGETRSYADLAQAVGRPSAVRAVGAANGRNPISLIVPCHRVIGSDGSLTGYAGGQERKRWLLQHERALYARAPGSSRSPEAPLRWPAPALEPCDDPTQPAHARP